MKSNRSPTKPTVYNPPFDALVGVWHRQTHPKTEGKEKEKDREQSIASETPLKLLTFAKPRHFAKFLSLSQCLDDANPREQYRQLATLMRHLTQLPPVELAFLFLVIPDLKSPHFPQLLRNMRLPVDSLKTILLGKLGNAFIHANLVQVQFSQWP